MNDTPHITSLNVHSMSKFSSELAELSHLEEEAPSYGPDPRGGGPARACTVLRIGSERAHAASTTGYEEGT